MGYTNPWFLVNSKENDWPRKKYRYKGSELNLASIPKVVGIFISIIKGQSFIKQLGFDSKKEGWTIVEDGDVPVSLTTREDVAQFIVQRAIMAYHRPDKVLRESLSGQ
jgi:hypothetical protein